MTQRQLSDGEKTNVKNNVYHLIDDLRRVIRDAVMAGAFESKEEIESYIRRHIESIARVARESMECDPVNIPLALERLRKERLTTFDFPFNILARSELKEKKINFENITESLRDLAKQANDIAVWLEQFDLEEDK